MIWVGDRERGSLVPRDEALLSVLDHGFTVADGVFETLKVDHGVVFALGRHLRRLDASADALGLPAPVHSVIREAVDEVVTANAPILGHLARLRITYTAGVGPLGTGREPSAPSLVVAAAPMHPWPEATEVVVVPWVRNERSAIAGVKSTSYAENVVALRYAHERGASEAVFANTVGELCEGSGSNVFVVVGEEILTPPLSSGCLGGITRELVIEWFGAVERAMPIGILAEADEVFITSSTRDVHPVITVDRRRWSDAGPTSALLREEFAARARLNPEP